MSCSKVSCMARIATIAVLHIIAAVRKTAFEALGVCEHVVCYVHRWKHLRYDASALPFDCLAASLSPAAAAAHSYLRFFTSKSHNEIRSLTDSAQKTHQHAKCTPPRLQHVLFYQSGNSRGHATKHGLVSEVAQTNGVYPCCFDVTGMLAVSSNMKECAHDTQLPPTAYTILYPTTSACVSSPNAFFI